MSPLPHVAHMRRTALLALLAVVCGAVAVGVATSGASASRTARRLLQASGTTQAHRSAAIRDARRLLAGVVAPPGAVVDSRSRGVGPHAQLLTSVLASAVDRESWTVNGRPEPVLAFVLAHLPPGSAPEGSGSGGPPPSESVIRAWPAIAGVLGVRWLQIQVTATSRQHTQLSVIAQSQWIVDRPTSEQIPPGVRRVVLSEGVPGHRPRFSRTVTDPRRVRALIGLLDALPLVQPVTINCPGQSVDPPVLAIAFLHDATGPTLARAQASPSATFSWPPAAPGWACVPVELSVRGRERPALAGDIIDPIQHLLGVRLAAGAHR